MFGRTVSIDGTEVFVPCLPSTPYSEVLMRAARQLKLEERIEDGAMAYRVLYRHVEEA